MSLHQETYKTLGLYLPKNGQIEPFKVKVMNWSTAWFETPIPLTQIESNLKFRHFF